MRSEKKNEVQHTKLSSWKEKRINKNGKKCNKRFLRQFFTFKPN